VIAGIAGMRTREEVRRSRRCRSSSQMSKDICIYVEGERDEREIISLDKFGPRKLWG